jgi:hypothetical protein
MTLGDQANRHSFDKEHPMDDKTRELDQIEAALHAAVTLEEYEQADADFFAVDSAARTAWLADKVRSSAWR